ncbi:hypothetical protein HGRIS_003481 [Hohenbuehelia grisea]|uniref:Uncharacterized protein n=1 Tax=Hohenbuehelia grisea TaxID=104357 RepID=A0ABR3JFM3_9AGAR
MPLPRAHGPCVLPFSLFYPPASRSPSLVITPPLLLAKNNMFATLITAATLASVAVSGVLADFAVSQPEFTQCQEAKFSWEGAKPPYSIFIVTPDDFCGEPIVDIGDHDKTVKNWTVALPAGLKVQLSLQDSNGEEGWSEPITVKPSNDASCVPAALLKKVESATPSSTPSSAESADPARTTLVVPAETSVSVASGPAPTPVGAANAGSNPLGKSNGAPALHQASTPVMIMTAIAAFAMFSL